MNKDNIKWIAFQPLTGGAYLGAEEAIGKPAEFILSFEGLNKYEEKDGKCKICGNEYYLETYLRKHNRLPKRYDIKEAMFDYKLYQSCNPTIVDYDTKEEAKPDYSDIDLVVAVPVCSGLSMATRANDETKEARNCNMKFITEYTLKNIRPKIYVFENAPTLMGSRGIGLVGEFKNMAYKYGYSVLFYKTDTNLHNNCQKRPRTFVVFFKHLSNDIENPFEWEYENNKISIKDYFDNIHSEYNNDVIETSKHNLHAMNYLRSIFGDDWREGTKGSLIWIIINNNKLDDFIKYLETNCPEALKYVNHINDKISQGKNYYADDICQYKEYMPAIQFKSISNILHPNEERPLTIRECLALMGHPSDFEWVTGPDKNHLAKIGQNVPVKTAKFIVEQCLKSLEKWNEPRGTEQNFAFQDNIKQKKVW